MSAETAASVAFYWTVFWFHSEKKDISHIQKVETESKEFLGCSYQMSTVFTGVFLCYFMFSNRASFCTAVSERLNRKCSKGSGPNPASLLSIQTLWSGSVSSFYCL